MKGNYATLSPREIAKGEILALDGLILLLHHLKEGKLNPRLIDPLWDISRNKFNMEVELEFNNVNDIKNIVSKTSPPYTAYKSLRRELKSLRAQKAEEYALVSHGEALKRGQNNERVIALKKRLKQLSFYEGEVNFEFDEAVERAVKAFQLASGIEADGIAGKGTINLLNLNREEKINRLKVNLERWRWLPDTLKPYHIWVDIANYELQLIDDQKTISTHKVIVGKPFRRTPVFHAGMNYLVFNPT